MTTTSIRTEYRGILFRSKLEADWALSFDGLGIPWQYEDRGRYFGPEKVFYLVDFWLPKAAQFVEVKGHWQPRDIRKAMAFCLDAPAEAHREMKGPDIVLVYCGPDGRFWGWPRLADEIPFDEFLLEGATELALLKCLECEATYFAPITGDWRCRACGFTEDWTHLPRCERWLAPWPFMVRGTP